MGSRGGRREDAGALKGVLQTGNNRTGENQYTKFKAWQLKYPGEPFPLRHRDGTVEWVLQLPKVNHSGRRRTRSDKGRKRIKNVDPDQITFESTQKDLARTAKEIAHFEEKERARLAAELPQNKERLRRRNREAQATYYPKRAKRIARERERCIPTDRICRCCLRKVVSTKQWTLITFKSQKKALCRSCYTTILRKRFNNNAKLCREFFKCVDYDKLASLEEHVNVVKW